MYFYFVRHGQTDWNLAYRVQGRIDNPLNETGKLQAKETGKKLKNMNINFDSIYVSPLKRARETAEIINEELNVKEFIIDENFTERSFGEMEGINVGDMKKIILNMPYIPKGFETDEEIISRVRNEADNLSTKRENVLVVCHSHTVKAMLISVDNKTYNFLSPLDNGQIVVIEVIDGKYTIKSII